MISLLVEYKLMEDWYKARDRKERLVDMQSFHHVPDTLRELLDKPKQKIKNTVRKNAMSRDKHKVDRSMELLGNVNLVTTTALN